MGVLLALYWFAVLFLGITAALWVNIPLLLVCAGLIAVRFQGRRWPCWLVCALAILAIPFVLNSGHHRMGAWDRQIRERGADSLTVFDRSAIYLGHVWMALGGFCIGAPEAAAETLLMIVPDEDRQREANWVFFAHDPSVLTTAERLARDLTAKNTQGRRAIDWPPGVYTLANHRVTLATAGGSIVLAPGRELGEFAASLEVPIRYTRGAELRLIRSDLLDLTIPESLFWALEQVGWLHAYVMRYRFKLRIAGDTVAIEDADPGA